MRLSENVLLPVHDSGERDSDSFYPVLRNPVVLDKRPQYPAKLPEIIIFTGKCFTDPVMLQSLLCQICIDNPHMVCRDINSDCIPHIPYRSDRLRLPSSGRLKLSHFLNDPGILKLLHDRKNRRAADAKRCRDIRHARLTLAVHVTEDPVSVQYFHF